MKVYNSLQKYLKKKNYRYFCQRSPMFHQCLTFNHHCKPIIFIHEENLVISNRRFVKNCSVICICFTTQLLYQKNEFYMYSLLFKANFYVAHALFAQIFSNFLYSLMSKTQIYQKAPFYATTVDISLIELCGIQISKNWLFSVVIK